MLTTLIEHLFLYGHYIILSLLQNPDTITDLQQKVHRTIKHAVEVEEKIPLDQVTNYDEVM